MDLNNAFSSVVKSATAFSFNHKARHKVIALARPGIHLEKDMSVPFGHTVARHMCLFEILCAPKSVECAFFEIVRAPNQCNEIY